MYALRSLLIAGVLITLERGVLCFANGNINLNAKSAISRQQQQQQQRKAFLPYTHASIASTIKNQKSSLEATSITKNEDEEKLKIKGGETTANDIPVWPCGDALDLKLIKIALPCIANFAISPLVGAVDLFWINRMGNTLAVAGQAAANQIFSSSFWLTSFLPSVTATLVAKQYAEGSEEGVQDAIAQALFLSTFVAIIGWLVLISRPDKLLSGVLKPGAPAREFARPYLLIRAFGFLPSLFSLVGFSAFRGTMDTITPLKISIFANLMNAILDPILIFNANMGVTGAAIATLVSEICSAVLFMTLMWKKNLVKVSKLFSLPKIERLMPLLKGGAALQLRNFALNLTFLAVTRVTQSIDDTGVAAAAHAMSIQTFQIGGIVLLALSTVAQFVVPGEMVEKKDPETGKTIGGLKVAKATVNRLMSWGFLLGTVLGFLQILILPKLLQASPLEEVRVAAKIPALLGSVYQVFNGLVFIGEGVMVGTGSFMQLSISTLIATLGSLVALKEFPAKYGLTGVWMGFGVFNTLRLAGVAIHQFVNGPLTKRKIEDKHNTSTESNIIETMEAENTESASGIDPEDKNVP